jgi:hypothetical protein
VCAGEAKNGFLLFQIVLVLYTCPGKLSRWTTRDAVAYMRRKEKHGGSVMYGPNLECAAVGA